MHSYMVRYNQPRVEEALTQLKAGSAQTRAREGGRSWVGAGRPLGALRMLGDTEGSGVIFSFSGQPGVGQLGGEGSLRVGVNAHFQK